jgi:hypothetical protein
MVRSSMKVQLSNPLYHIAECVMTPPLHKLALGSVNAVGRVRKGKNVFATTQPVS